MTNNQLPADVAELRLLLGYLGEKDQYNWWPCSFLAPASEAFLRPVFARTSLLAQYQGVCEAALRVHDWHIGLGRHYHLYRLPDALERAAGQVLLEADFADGIKPWIANSDAALQRLSALSEPPTEFASGPVRVGSYAADDLQTLLRRCAGYYQQAIRAGEQSLPYLQATGIHG
ncbi:BrxE family protein [uncultured Thiohalocapsa sp.]|uniref:BrxE family protein n=1 Tax=uncultured Thiohalocapsa sp. TaxID=768990 RepID=UPI0025E15038|nr:BrxE family protein [uncultured Thiohalocapsa sp.]